MTTINYDDEAFTATYDAENRLLTLTSTSHSATFAYGFDGFLVKQIVDGVETRFVNAGGLCLQERDASNNVTRSYVWDSVSPGGIGGLLELTTGGQHYNYLYDGKGNVRALIDANQNVVAAYSYDTFGVQTGQSGTLDQPYRFSTKRYYDGIGLNYYGYRFYAASLGRWMTRDPLGEAGGLNLYGAMGNSTVNWSDMFGLTADLIFFNSEKDPKLYQSAVNIPTDPNAIIISGHGTPNNMEYPKGQEMSPAELAELIKSLPKYKPGMKIIIGACETGMGDNSFAQQLTNYLNKSDIDAPNNKLKYFEFGDWLVDQNGQWIGFKYGKTPQTHGPGYNPLGGNSVFNNSKYIANKP